MVISHLVEHTQQLHYKCQMANFVLGEESLFIKRYAQNRGLFSDVEWR